MLVSVIMPVKNAAGTVTRAANSILQQTYREYEFIIVNDHSTDGTVEKLKLLADNRIKLVDSQGSGIARALNTGLSHARGQYIARMDADDYSLPERLEKQVRYARNHPRIGVISCRVSHDGHHPRQQGYRHYVHWLNNIITPGEHYVNRFADAPLAHPTAFFKASLVADYGNYTVEPVPEDFELWLRWLAKGVRFAKIPEVLLQWADPPQRASRMLENYAQQGFFCLKAIYFKDWWQKNHRQRQLWVWGYGREVFAKVKPLIEQGVQPAGYIDLQERPASKRRVRHYTTVTANQHDFYLIFVGDRLGKEKIAGYLNSLKLQAGSHYLFMT